MATVRSKVSITVRDNAGNERRVLLPGELTSTGINDIDLLVKKLILDTDNVIAGRATGAELTIRIDPDANIKPAPGDNTNVRAGATLSFQDSAGNANPFYFPTFNQTKQSNNVVNASDPQVSALITTITAPVVEGTATWTATDEDDRKLDGGYIRGFLTGRK